MRYTFIYAPIAISGNKFRGQPRIVRFDPIKCSFAIKPSYATIEDLVARDQNYKVFKKQKRAVAKLIVLDKNIETLSDLIFTPDKYDTKSLNYRLISHTIEGKRGRKTFSGIHFLEFPLPKFVEDFVIVEPENELGVYTATFSIINNGRKLTKENPSTMFPKKWSKQQLHIECLFAMEYKKSVNNSKIFFISKTMSSIPVEIHLNESGKLLTIYPVRN